MIGTGVSEERPIVPVVTLGCKYDFRFRGPAASPASRLRRMRIPHWLPVAVIVVVVAGPHALAQGTDRKGIFGGVSIGLGNSSPDMCAGCDTGLAAEARLGAMVTPRVGLLAQFCSVGSAPEVPSDTIGRHNGFLAAVQYWPARRVWLKAGAGVVGVERSTEGRYDDSTTHFGGLAGIGFEVNPGSKAVVEFALQDLLSGDSKERVSPLEADHKSTVNTLLLTVGLSFYRRR